MRREEIARDRCARWVGASLTCFVALTGCINVDTIHEYRGGPALEPPRRVVVKDFAYSPDDVSLVSGPGAEIAGEADKTPKTAAELELGRRVSSALSRKLVEKLLDLGLYAQRFDGQKPPFDNIVVIEGQFISIDEGDRLKRMVVGFGFGRSEVRTSAQVYQVAGGKRRVLQDFVTSASSSYAPGFAARLGAGAAAGVVATAAVVGGGGTVANETWGSDVEAGAERTAAELVAQMKPFFIDQAWIPAYGY